MSRTPRVRDLMTIDVPLTTLNTPVMDAARMMRSADRDCLIVFDLGRATGIVTERDITRKVTAEDREPLRVHVADIVSSPLITIHPDKSAREAAALMVRRKIRHLPVVKEDRLLGIITQEDFAKHISRKGARGEEEEEKLELIVEEQDERSDEALALMQRP